MRRSGLSLFLARLGFIVILLLLVPLTALAVLFAAPLEPWREAKAEQLLSDAIDLRTKVNGPVQIGFGWEPTIFVANIEGDADDLPDNLKGISAKSLSLSISVLPLLMGRLQLSTLVVDGLKVDIDIPIETDTTDEDDMDIAGFVRDFVRSRFANDLLLSNAELNYINQDTGFTIRYAFDSLRSSPSGGAVVVTGIGRINGEPWKADGKIEPPGANPDQRSFAFSGSQAGVTSTLAGIYALADPADTIDAVFTGSAPELVKLLDVYDVKSDFEGNGAVSARFTGTLNAPKMSELGLKLAFENGTALELTGGVGDAVKGTGLDLALTGTLPPPARKEGEEKTLFDLGITGFSGRIEGRIDEVLARDVHVVTSSVKAQLHDIGPISAERVWKDAEGRVGLYEILVLAGDPARPTLKITGTIIDVLQFQGVELKGDVDFLTADFLDLAAEDKAPLLGHITGNVAVSDADGSLGIEQFAAKVTDSSVLALSVNLIFDDLANANELKFDTHLDIRDFKAFATVLGSDVQDLGTVKFDGTVTGGDQQISATGTTLVGETTIVGTVTGAFAQGRPTLSGDIATALLHLSDLIKLSSINAVYEANVDDTDIDVFDYSKAWEALFVDLQIKVAKIAGGGDGASNIQGRVTYLAGIVGLDPVTMNFLGGSASTNGKIDTTGAVESFALKGRVDNMKIGAVLRELKVSYPVSGALQVRYDLTGTGDTMVQIPKSLDGSLSITLRNGWLGTSLLDLAGLSLPAWLLTRTPGGNQANLVCMVAPLTFAKGRGTTRGFVLETDDVQVVGVGFIDFRQNEVNLQFKPKALRQQFIKIAQPFAVRGPLTHPQLRLTGAPVAGVVVEVLAFPFNLLDTIVQPGTNERGHVPCRIVQTSRNGNGLLNLPLVGRQLPIPKAPQLFGPSSPLPLGILKQPLFGGSSR